jgi:hypothetical protein
VHALEPLAGEAAAAVDGGRFDGRQHVPVWGGLGQRLQHADYRQPFLDGGGLDLVLGDVRAADHRGPSVR